MESVEKDCSALGNLFQTIINDLRNSSPIWEDFTYKATKLHQCLKTTLVAISSFLEAFQKVADMATNSRGATKEIGSALTRLCMRHRSIETCLKALTNSVLDSVVAPLQERLEDWKKVVAQLDKDHAKEYKKARQEIKKAASDTMRLQKKVNKGKNEMLMKLDSAMHEVNDKYLLLEETEKTSVRTALIEERQRFCIFISCIKPFVDHEVQLLTEVTHLQEIMHYLCLQAGDPHSLPPSSEQVITDLKGVDIATVSLQGKQHPSPPSSPSSLGSRKSSVCSMASINSCSSTSSKSHSPGHTLNKHNMLQDGGAGRGDSSTDAGDSGSTPGSPIVDLDSTLTSSSFSTNTLPFSSAPPTAPRMDRARPHTISAGSEKTYARLAVKPELFEPLAEKAEGAEEGREGQEVEGMVRSQSVSSAEGHYARPAAAINKMQPVLPPHCPRPKMKPVAPPALPPEMQPDYANTMELHQLAMEKREREQQQGGDTPNPAHVQLSTQQNPQKPAGKASVSDSCLEVLELEEAIRSLDSVTAALGAELPSEPQAPAVIAERTEEKWKEQEGFDLRRSTQARKQNSLELAEAIRELEQSTAALHSTYDTDSHSSLPSSSGYATMDSTPSSSDDVIPPGAGANVMRRGSMNNPKPPPPVRRTASISYAQGPRSAQRPSVPGGEGFYAELQTVQQSIQEKHLSQQQPPAVYSKPGRLQRQHSMDHTYPQQQQPAGADITGPSPDRSSVSSGGVEHYAVPVIPGAGSASLLQSLNAKFASLNQQYQDPHFQQQQQQQQHQQQQQQQQEQVAGTYVGQAGNVGPGADRAMMPPPAAVLDLEHRGQGQLVRSDSAPQQSHYSQGPVSSRPYEHAQHYHHPHPVLPHDQGEEDLPPPPPPEEDFPMPPSEQELAEMETVYARPPPVNPKPKMTGDLMMELKRRMSHDEYSNV